MAVERVWEEDWSPREEYGSHLRVLRTVDRPHRIGTPVAARRAARARMLRRRRRALMAFAAIVTVVILAWPGHAFGGVTGSGVIADTANSSMLASGQVYVVHSGDSISSIARLINPDSPQTARVALVRELGSSAVVAGEHVLIP